MGSLTKTAATTSTAAVNLTTEGTLGWANWEAAVASWAVSQTMSGGLTISAAGTGGAGGASYGGDARTISWTNGTPTGSGSSSNGRYTSGGAPNGVTITVPASTTAYKVRLHTGVYSGIATITASLSDASAGSVADSTTFDSVSASTFFPGYIEFDYQANSAAQTLSVAFVLTTDYGGGNVAMMGVTITAGVGSPGLIVVTNPSLSNKVRTYRPRPYAPGNRR